MKRFLLFLSLVLLQSSLFANVRLPLFFSDHMVLQRDHAIPVWGWADAKEKITVTINNQTRKTTAGKDGTWRVDLAYIAAGGPYVLAVTGKNTITIQDVLVGDVWICSGQSNMEMPIAGWGKIMNYEEEIRNADYPTIRQFDVPNKVASTPKKELSGGDWKICNPENAGQFSAVAYFFARELTKKLNIPIGLLNTNWGGTQVESWISRSGFENSPDFSEMIGHMKNVDLDELVRQKEEALKEHMKELQGTTAVTPEEAAHWKDPAFDDAAWHILKVPGLWEGQEPGDVDGWVWVRKTIAVDPADAGKAATLELAKIDDNDETYLNGQRIGATVGYNLDRKYLIPAGMLKAGKNVIVVKIDDTGGGGGIYGDPSNVRLTIDGKTVSLAGDWKYRVEKISAGSGALGPNSYPTLLYNAMISPLIPYAVKGAIWYQGESNAGRSYEYRKSFPLMIRDWRQKWGQGDFPFYFVQLATFGADGGNSQKGSGWAELREAQSMTLSLPNTGMAVATDIGDVKDIHPKNKQEVGRRLAEIALNQAYGSGNEYSGPVYESMKAEGNSIRVSFTHTGSGLQAKDKYGYLKGFEIAGADQHFHYAKARIEGNNVIVWSEEVPNPVAVRYGWADDASDDNLYNKDGFPAGPFRTDNWKGRTEGVHFRVAE